MIGRDALVLIVASLTGALFAATGLLLLQSLFVERVSRRRTRKLETARDALIELASGVPISAERRRPLASLPRRLRFALLTELTQSLMGDSLAALRRTADELGIVEQARKQLGSRLWWRRLAATRLLTGLDTADDRLIDLLDDPHPLVRAEAAEWAAFHPSDEAIHRLVGMLAERDGLARFRAQDALIRIGPGAIPALLEILDHRDASGDRDARLETALEVAAEIGDPRLLEPALRHATAAEPKVRSLAAAILARLGGTAAAATLLSLLDDQTPEVRHEAATALGRVGDWQASVPVARLLEDRSWEVRRSAGLALRNLGAPGLLLLRVGTRSHDAFAADMARQVLDLADLDQQWGAAES